MKKLLIAASIASALAAPAVATAQGAGAQSPHTFTGNIGFVSDYRFRGISQTLGEPALQGGFDYSHSSGFYAGTWASNVYGGTNGSGLGVAFTNGNLEWDVYAGYKFEPIKGITGDVGLLHYMYPGANWPVATRDKYTNTELYLGASWNWLSVKYSHSLTDYFGIKNNTMSPGGVASCGIDAGGGALPAGSPECAPLNAGGSKGSNFLEANVSFDLGNKWTLVGNVGRLSVKNYGLFDYTTWKLGVTKEWLGLTWGASYIDTNAKAGVYRTSKTVGAAPGAQTEVFDPSKSIVVLSVQKTF